MKKIFFVALLMTGMSFMAINVTVAQDTKAKAACCNKASTASTNMKNANCPMAETTKAKAGDPKNCPMAGKKDCPMAGKKDCTKANCPMKSGAVAGKKCCAKTGAVAEAKK